MEFKEEFTLSATLREALPIGTGPIGTRMYYEIIGGGVGYRVSRAV